MGKKALAVGEAYRSADLTVWIKAHRDPFVSPTGDRNTPDPGQHWVGVRARACVPKSAQGPVTVAWSTFSAVDANGELFSGLAQSASMSALRSNDWPSPQYPLFGQVAPGECAEGWLLIPVIKGAEIDRIRYTTIDGVLAAEWALSS